MSTLALRPRQLAALVLSACAALTLHAQTSQTPSQTSQTPPATQAPRRGGARPPLTPEQIHANKLIGEYGPYRANNDLLSYDLDIRVDPEKKLVSGKNTIRFKMLKDGDKIQLELVPTLNIDGIKFGSDTLKYDRDGRTLFVNFPRTLRAGQVYSIVFAYSGTPQSTGRFGGFTFGKDPVGRPWVYTACEGLGASIWWPNKDQWKDEPQEGMWIRVAVPNGLTDVSNGRFAGKKDLGDGYTQWNWHVQYPINNYDVSLNIGTYVHFGDKLGALSLDYYVLPEDLDKAKAQFSQAPGMIKAYEHYFGQYPFQNDGYKLVEAPYSGMEHQSAVTYGNLFKNGYLGRDWTGVGISPRFDFIIIHESGHEWFGNAITAADPSDMWIHEGWTTYLETLYVEYHYGHADALKYLNGYKPKVHNDRPIVGEHGVNISPPEDQYFKGALFLNTLRSVVNNDALWWKTLHGLFQTFKYKTIMTEDVVAYFNQHTGMNLTPLFDQYLRHTAIPTLELKFDQPGSVSYRWQVDEKAFAMPIRVGDPAHWQIIRPTTEWQTMKTPLTKDTFDVATDLYYVNVNKN